MRRSQRFIPALLALALVPWHPGRTEGRPVPGDKALGSSSEALPEKPQPNLARKISPSPIVVQEPERKPRRLGHRRAWLILGLAQHGAAAFDAYTTRQAIGRGCSEGDPLMRPFARSAAIYPAIQVGPALFDLLALRMMNGRTRWAQRVWWVPQAIATAGFLWSGSHNTTLPGRRIR